MVLTSKHQVTSYSTFNFAVVKKHNLQHKIVNINKKMSNEIDDSVINILFLRQTSFSFIENTSNLTHLLNRSWLQARFINPLMIY